VGGEGGRKLSDEKNYQSARGTLGQHLVISVPWNAENKVYGNIGIVSIHQVDLDTVVQYLPRPIEISFLLFAVSLPNFNNVRSTGSALAFLRLMRPTGETISHRI
jgi:hypothetical protein